MLCLLAETTESQFTSLLRDFPPQRLGSVTLPSRKDVVFAFTTALRRLLHAVNISVATNSLKHEPPYYFMMNNSLHDSSSQSMSVDIRLCGNIPRSDMKEQLLSQGAPCSLAALRGEAKTVSTSCLAVTNAPDDAHSTHRTIGVCDSLPALLLHNKSDMRGPLQEKQPLTPLFEPPSWAVPARGETRLEVRLQESSL